MRHQQPTRRAHAAHAEDRDAPRAAAPRNRGRRRLASWRADGSVLQTLPRACTRQTAQPATTAITLIFVTSHITLSDPGQRGVADDGGRAHHRARLRLRQRNSFPPAVSTGRHIDAGGDSGNVMYHGRRGLWAIAARKADPRASATCPCDGTRGARGFLQDHDRNHEGALCPSHRRWRAEARGL